MKPGTWLLSLSAAAAALAVLPAWAQSRETTLLVEPGTGGSARRIAWPVAVLSGGRVVEGVPALRHGKAETVSWEKIARVDFVPADRVPTAIIHYRDGHEEMLDIEPCWLASQAPDGDSGLDIHIVSRIAVKTGPLK